MLLPSPVMVNLEASISLLAPGWAGRFAPLRIRTPLEMS